MAEEDTIKGCKKMFSKPGTTNQMSNEEIVKTIKCVPDTIARPRYYKFDEKSKSYTHED
jgi:hypothetical protein